jgi:hypothetical protein
MFVALASATARAQNSHFVLAHDEPSAHASPGQASETFGGSATTMTSSLLERPPATGTPTLSALSKGSIYAINLQSTLSPVHPASLPELSGFESHRLYTTRFEKDGRIWHRLRLGFFPSMREAGQGLDDLRSLYPQAWVTSISAHEVEGSAETRIRTLLALGPEQTTVAAPLEGEPLEDASNREGLDLAVRTTLAAGSGMAGELGGQGKPSEDPITEASIGASAVWTDTEESPSIGPTEMALSGSASQGSGFKPTAFETASLQRWSQPDSAVGGDSGALTGGYREGLASFSFPVIGDSNTGTLGGTDKLSDEEATLFDGRLCLSISQTNREELLRAIGDAPGAFSTGVAESEDFWHREAGLELNALASGPVTLRLSGHFFDERAPDTSGLGGLNIGEVSEWQESSHQDLGLDLGLFGGRLSVSTGLASSQIASSLEGDKEDGAFTFGDDLAAWSRFEAKVLDAGPIGFSAYGHYSLTDPLYQQLGSSEGLVSLEAGEQMEFGGTIGFGPFEFSPSHSIVSDTAHKTEKLAGTIAFGSHSLTLSQDTTSNFDDEGVRTTRRRAHNASVDLDLDEYRSADGDIWLFVPSSVSLSGTFADIEGSSGSDDQERGFGLGLAWYWESADTTVDLWRTITDHRAFGQQSANSEDWTLDLAQDFYGNWWNVSLYLSFYQSSYEEVGWASDETGPSGGSSVSFHPEGLPDIALSFDFNGNESDMTEYNSSHRYAGFAAALDFSKFVPKVDGETEPYLKLNYFGEVSMFSDSASGATTDHGQAVSLTGGIKF